MTHTTSRAVRDDAKNASQASEYSIVVSIPRCGPLSRVKPEVTQVRFLLLTIGYGGLCWPFTFLFFISSGEMGCRQATMVVGG